MLTELYREAVDSSDGDKIAVSATTNGSRSIVSVTAQRGGYGITFAVPLDVARSLAKHLLAAANAAAVQ